MDSISEMLLFEGNLRAFKVKPRETGTAENHPALEGWIEVGSRVTDVKNIFSFF